MQEIGEGILQRSRYAMLRLAEIPGVKAPAFSSTHFKEFAVNFDGTGKSVEEINQALLEKKIFGGVDLSKDFPELGNTALYCVTEVHNQADIDALVKALTDIVSA
jgi:glycine dehydrogenase subunit 1